MEQISQESPQAPPVSQVQPVTSPFPRPHRWLIILVIILFALLIFGTAGYYYLEIYTPAQYAEAVIPIYDEIRSQEVGTGSLKGGGDYEGLLLILDQYQTFLTKEKVKLSNLKPSPIDTTPSFLANTERSKQIQEDLTKILEVFLSSIAQAKKQAQFMIKAKELLLLLRPDLTIYPPPAVPAGQGAPSPPPPSTVGEHLSVWEARVPKAKEVAKDLFSKPQDLRAASFEELKSLWLETEQGLDVLIPFLKNQDPSLSLSEAQKLVPEGDKAVFAKVDKIDEFLPMLENVLIRNNAENILNSQFSAGSSIQSELKLRGGRLEAAIKDIKAE